MNNLNRFNILKKYIVIVAIFFATILQADEGAVTFTQGASYSTATTPKAIEFDGTNLYIANGDNGIMVLDENLTLEFNTTIDSKENIINLTVDTEYIYAVSDNQKLYILDIANGSVTGQIKVSGTSNDIVVSNNYIYIANGTNGIAIIDATTPTSPNHLGTLTTTDATSLYLKDDVLYLADDWGGFKTIDISTNSNPTIVNQVDGTFFDIAIDNDKLFAVGTNSVEAYDISNPILPLKQSSVEAFNSLDSYAYDSNIYLVKTSQIDAYTTIDMSSITTNGTYIDTTGIKDIQISNSVAYMITDSLVQKAIFSADIASTQEDADDVGPIEIPQYNVNTDEKLTKQATLPEGENDIDIIKVTLTAGILTIDIDTQIAGLKVSVLDSSFTSTNDINNSDTNESIEQFTTSVAGGDYYIKVEGLDGGYGEYKITAKLLNDDYPDEISHTSIIYDGEEISGNIVSSEDKDMFKIYLSSHGSLTLSSSFLELSSDIYSNDTANNTLASTGSFETDGIVYTVPHSGYYFISISGPEDYDYSFSYSFESSSIGEYEDDEVSSYKLLLTDSDMQGDSLSTNYENIFIEQSNKVSKNEFDTTISETLPLSTASDILDIATIGKYAYIIEKQEIKKINISTMATLGTLNIASVDLKKLVIDGDFAYTYSRQNNTIYKVNISANTPVLEQTISLYTDNTINDIDLKYTTWSKDGSTDKTRNAYLYIATNSGLKVYSIDESIDLTTYDTDTSAIAMLKIYNNRLYTIKDSSFKIYDIGVPVYASLLGEVAMDQSEVSDIILDDTYAYLSPNMIQIDITDDREPKKIKTNSISENTLRVKDEIAYSLGDNNLKVYETKRDYGDTNATAKSIALTSITKGNISNIVNQYSDATKDIDVFRLDVTTSGTLTIDFVTTNQDIKLTSSNTNENVSVGVYYITVQGDSKSDDGNYSITTTFTPDDHSDTYTGATDLTLNTTLSQNNLLSTGEDIDWFKIVLTDRSTISISTVADTNLNTKIELYYDDVSTQISKEGFNTDSLNPNASYDYQIDTTLNEGTYYIKISADEDSNITKKQGDYSLQTTVETTGEFTMSDGIDMISDYRISQVAFSDKFIYTFTKDNKIVGYSHLLEKIGEKYFPNSVDTICNKPFILNNTIYTNILNQNKVNDTDLECSGYYKQSLEFDDEQQSYKDNAYYTYSQEKFFEEMSTTNINNSITSMALKDNNIFIATENSIQTYDITDKNNEPVLKSFYGKHNITRFYVSGDYTYILDSSIGLFIYDQNEKLQSNYIVNTSDSVDIVVSGDTTYLLTRNNGLLILNTSDKTNPVLIKTLEHQNSMSRLVMVGEYLYISRYSGLSIVSLSSNEFIAQYESSNYGFEALDIDGDYAYMAGYDTLEVLDISSKTNPTLKFSDSYKSNISSIASDDTNIYYIKDGYLNILNKSKYLNITSRAEDSFSVGSSISYTTITENTTTPQTQNYSEGDDYGDYYNTAQTINDTNSKISGAVSSDDSDWFTVNSSDLTTLQVTVPNSDNVFVSIYRISGSNLYDGYPSYTYDSNGTEILSKDNIIPSNYYIQVSSNEDINYTISIDTKQAKEFSTIPVVLKGTNSSEDRDYFKFTLDNAEYLNIHDGSTSYEVFNSNGNWQTTNGCFQAGTYYITAYKNEYESDFGVQEYEIKLAKSSAYYDSISKGTVSDGTVISGVFDYESNNYEDWYKFSLSSTKKLEIYANTNMYMELYDSDGTYQYSSDDKLTRSLNAGTYYLKVQNYNYDYDNTNYELNIKENALDENVKYTGWYNTLQVDDTKLIKISGNQIITFDKTLPYNNEETTTLTYGQDNLDISAIEVSETQLYVENTSGDLTTYDIDGVTISLSDTATTAGSAYDGAVTEKIVDKFWYILEDGNMKRYYADDTSRVEELESVYVNNGTSFITDSANKYAYIKDDYGTLTILDLDSLHYEQNQDTFSNISALDADENYIYEYGQQGDTASTNNKYILKVQTQNDTFATSIYRVPDVSALVSLKDSMAVISVENTISLIDFSDENEVAILKDTISFDNNISLIKAHPTLSVVYLKTENSDKIKVYNYDNQTFDEVVFSSNNDTDTDLNQNILPDINSIYIKNNKLYLSSSNYGLQVATIQANGSLSICKTVENVGINVQNVFSMDGTTMNYTTSKTRADIGNNNDDLNTFFLTKDDIIDGTTDSIYGVGKAPSEGCFIATAAFGSYFEPHVKVLRDFRDNYLLTNDIGKVFVEVYYTYSPSIATAIANNEFAKTTIRVILTPFVYLIKYPLYGLVFLMMVLIVRVKINNRIALNKG